MHDPQSPQGGANGQLEEQFSLKTLGAFLQPLEQTYRRCETTDRISIRRALHRLLARPPKIFDRLGDAIAASVMMRQIAQMIVEPGDVKRLHRQRHPLHEAPCGARSATSCKR